MENVQTGVFGRSIQMHSCEHCGATYLMPDFNGVEVVSITCICSATIDHNRRDGSIQCTPQVNPPEVVNQ